MSLIALGPNGPQIPPLGIGTWSWGDTLFWSYGKDYGVDQVKSAFDSAIAAGICFFDTAEVYGLGESERLLGQFMLQTTQPIHVATKYFPVPWRWGTQAVSDALSASLQRLQVDRVDLYQVHWPFDFLMGQKTLLNALADEVEKGRIGAIGVSNYSATQMRQAHEILAKRQIPLAVNQVRYSLLTRQIESNGVMQAARDLGTVILAYSPLAQGLLTGKYRANQAIAVTGARQLDPKFKRSGLEKLEPVLTALEKIADRHGKTPAQVALNWLIAQGNVIPIPGAKNAEQAQQNAGAIGWQISSSEEAQLDQLTRSFR